MTNTPATARLTSLDALRGAVMLLLIPNTHDGLGLGTVAQQLPDSRLAAFLHDQFSHAQWSGAKLWDLVMPSFLFIAGVSLAFSRAARVHDAASRNDALVPAALRAAVLLVLGLLLMISVDRNIDLLWPLMLLMLGLPLGEWLRRALHRGPDFPAARVERWLTVIVLVAACAWLAANSTRANWELNDILPQLALAYVFAFLIAGRELRVQVLIVAGILFAYWLLFALYPLPPADLDMASVGVAPADEVFRGFFAHWNKGTNPAAHFDRWFLNLMPREQPFLYNDHGYATLSFIPAAASVMLGVITGDLLRAARDARRVRNALLFAGAIALGVGMLLGATLVPIIKSIWTPSWVIFSSGWTLLFFGLLYHVIELRGRRSWAVPLVVAGLNPIVLYVFARYYRYWIAAVWDKPTGGALLAGPWGPVVEAAVMLVSLWLLAYVLYRARIFVRV